MPRVHHRKARKDYPNEGIQKGDMYYTWRIKLARGGMTRRSLKRPQPEQLTNSAFQQEWIPLNRDIGGFDGGKDEAQDLADRAREVGEGEQEKLDNMPQGLQEGHVGEMIQERADECEQLSSDLENCVNDYPEDAAEDSDEISAWRETVQSLAQ